MTFYIKAPKKISVNKLLTSKLRANIHLPLLQYLKGNDMSLYLLNDICIIKIQAYEQETELLYILGKQKAD